MEPRPVVVALDAVPAPLEMLARVRSLPYPCLLDGAAPDHPLGRFAFLGADPVAVITAPAADWPAVRDQLRASCRGAAHHDACLPPFQGGWMGWLSYELGTAFDRMPRAALDDLPTPDIALALYDWVVAWDVRRGKAWLISTGIDAAGHADSRRARRRADTVLDLLSPRAHGDTGPIHGAVHLPAPAVVSPEAMSNFTADRYRDGVRRVIDHILAGDIFQANLAQRFSVPFNGDSLALYAALRRRTAAPMAAFVAHGAIEALSASPERFLAVDPRTGAVETRPIKGTRPRGATAERDAALAAELAASEKDRAENVMIVDLLRNDLSRVCLPGSVHASQLCQVESHPTVHHLVSTVRGTLRPESDALDLLAAAFPGGSITGAPKLRATEILAAIEPVTRGVYCGAIGWFGLDGGMDTSIAIRTIVVTSGRASVHAGGAVTAASTPDEEYLETLDKARAPLAALADLA